MVGPINITIIAIISAIAINLYINMIYGLIYFPGAAGPANAGYALLELVVQMFDLNIVPAPEWLAFFCFDAEGFHTLAEIAHAYGINFLRYLC